jgi:DNA-binding transcriptional regulator YiaG
MAATIKRRSEADDREPQRVQSDEIDYSNPTDATRIREMLKKLGLSQAEGARALEISERMMRYYCAGEPVPKVIFLAMERLVGMRRRVVGK